MNSLGPIAGPIAFTGLAFLGLALLWALRLMRPRRELPTDDALRQVLSMAGVILALLGAIGAIVSATLWAAVVACPVFLIIILMAVGRFRLSERRSLLFALALAAEKGIPLQLAARAFAQDRSTEIGLGALRMADLLDAGVPLADALRRSGHPLPKEAALAADLGAELGMLGPALRRATTRIDDQEAIQGAMFEKFFYLLVVAIVALSVLSFLMIFIVPVFVEMFTEFDLELPALTQLVIAASNFTVKYWFLALPPFLLLAALALFDLLHYVGWPPHDRPTACHLVMLIIFGPIYVICWSFYWLVYHTRRADRLVIRRDAALIMSALALAVRQGGSLTKAIDTLAERYPVSFVRRRLDAARRSMNQGADWCDSLQSAGLIRPADVAVFKSAERAGNLAWALDEMADSSVRRLAYRLRAWFNVLFPAFLLTFGFFIGAIVIGMFLPLVSLIEELAG